MNKIVLDATTSILKAFMSGAPATTNPDVLVTWADNNGTTFIEGKTTSALNGATVVSICPAPAASTRRIIVGISIYNRDTAAVTVTVEYDENSTLRHIVSLTLAVGDTWTLDGTFDTSGNLKTSGSNSIPSGTQVDGVALVGGSNVLVVAPATTAATAKTAIVNADYIPLVDTEAANVLKKTTWTSIKAFLKTYFDSLYPAGSGTSTGSNTGDQTISDATISTTDITTNNVSTSKHGFAPKGAGGATYFLDATGAYSVPAGSGDPASATHAATSKATPVDADELPLVDSAASNVLKKLTWANLKATFLATVNTWSAVQTFSSPQVITGITDGTQLGQYNLPANTTNTSTTITLSGTDLLRAGMTVTGTGIPANTTISSITNTVTAVLSNAATVTTTGLNNANTLVFTSVPAPSGLVGETYHWSGYTDALGTSAANLCSFSLPAGKWDVQAFVLSFDNHPYSSNTTFLVSWLGAVSASATGTTRGRDKAYSRGYTAEGWDGTMSPLRRIISISGTTTFYLGGYYPYVTGSVDWSITAVRIK